MLARPYLMENENEAFRMSMKTDPAVIEKQALWAGLKPGMRVADVGCGPGKTSALLAQITGDSGEVVGIDCSKTRIAHAEKHYPAANIRFICRDINDCLEDLGTFDFVWVRFLLEYFRSTSFDMVRHLSGVIGPGGILCLIDLDLNCLNHYGMPQALENSLSGLMKDLERKQDFDPYVGRKLYSYLYDLDFQNIAVDMSPHHLIYGKLQEKDAYNWLIKTIVAAKNSGYNFFKDFNEGFPGFYEAFRKFFFNPRRFTYTPVIACTGQRPAGLPQDTCIRPISS